jgi:hypothetical protein
MARALLVTSTAGQSCGTLLNVSPKASVDFEIISVTRNAQSASPRKLPARLSNIKLVNGDLDAIDSVFRKLKQPPDFLYGVSSAYT